MAAEPGGKETSVNSEKPLTSPLKPQAMWLLHIQVTERVVGKKDTGPARHRTWGGVLSEH